MTGKNTSSRKLLSPEREERILAALGDGVRTIAELAGELQVSEATVRRDLQSLERRALAMRVHGGAIRMQPGRAEPLFHEKTGLRAGEKEVPAKIVESLRQRAVTNGTLGMHWNDAVPAAPFPRIAPRVPPIETQAAMIELFAEAARDDDAVDAMKIWLLAQKQTHVWASARASANALFALFLENGNGSFSVIHIQQADPVTFPRNGYDSGFPDQFPEKRKIFRMDGFFPFEVVQVNVQQERRVRG